MFFVGEIVCVDVVVFEYLIGKVFVFLWYYC